MTGSSYHERDYAFGQAMLALRSAIGLTQAGLANYLGVSRRAVGEWEVGGSYPKTEHFKQFITLAVERRALPEGRQVEEIHLLWQAAHQKTLLDEIWLEHLLDNAQPNGASHLSQRGSPQLREHGPLLDWENALAIPSFYGREREMNVLIGWLVEERCRVVSLVGIGGSGKSALAVSLMHRVADRFDVVIWRSLQDIPSCDFFFEDLLQVLVPQQLSTTFTSSEERQSILLGHMRANRVLLVLDNIEAVFEDGEYSGRTRPEYQGIGRVLRLTAETEHRSCILLTSREKPIDLISLEGVQTPVRTMRLGPLDENACKKLLLAKGVKGNAADQERLVALYTGNPLAIKIVAQTIVDLFAGEIAPFLEQGEVIYGGVRELLQEQFARLSALEQSALIWLAILRDPVTLEELLAFLSKPVPRDRLLEAFEALQRRSLVKRGRQPGSFTLQSIVLEFATKQLVADVSREILDGKPVRLIEHSLELTNAAEHARAMQVDLIVVPILMQLRSSLLLEDELETRLRSLLAEFADWDDSAQGYGPANLVTLLNKLAGN